MNSLHPCPHCSRHHRACERVCPFCGGELPACEAAPTARSLGRMSRAMLVAAGAAALGGASCQQSVPAPAYGLAVIPDSSARGAGGGDGGAGEDGGGAGTGAGGVGQADGGSDS